MRSEAELRSIKEDLVAKGVKYCLGAYVDLHGAPKGKVAPVDHFEDFAKGSELYTGYALDGLGQSPNDDEIASVPDLERGVQLPWQPEVMWYPADLTFHGEPYPVSTRVAFGRVLEEARSMGFNFQLGIECELYFLERTFAVNVHSVAYAIKHAARLLHEGGRIVNMASFVGVIGLPFAAAYATSKAAVIQLTRLAAMELAPRRITVNTVSPGAVRTPAVTEIPDNPEIDFIERRAPLRRLAEPEEIAAACHFLASDEAAYITGQNLVVDGGLTAGWTEYDVVAPANVQDGRWIDDV